MNQQLIASPFGPQEITIQPGQSVAQIARDFFGALGGVVAFVRCPEGARQQWEEIPRDMWNRIKPLGSKCLMFEFVPAGGKGGNIFAQIASIVVTITAAAFLGPGAFGIAGLGLTGTALNLATAAVAVGAGVLVNSLFPAQSPSVGTVIQAEQDAEVIANVEADNNVLGLDKFPPRVIGTRRISPPLACYPQRYLLNGKEIIEILPVLTGHHNISDIRVAGTPIDEIEGASYVVSDGNVASAAQTIVTNVARLTSVNEQLTRFSTEQASDNITDQATPANAEPVTVVMSPGWDERIEQISIRLAIDPMVVTTSDTDEVRIPLRISFWEIGTPGTVHNLPEIHIRGRVTAPRLKEILIRWDQLFTVASSSSDYNYEFYQRVPPAATTLSDGSSGDQWQAHSHFVSGSNLRDSANVASVHDGITVFLDPDTFPKSDEYVFSIQMGQPIIDNDFNAGTYEYNSVVESLFLAKSASGNWAAPAGTKSVTGGINVQFCQRVMDRQPIQAPGFAHIGIKLENTDAKNITCLASAIVNDWNGSAWATAGATLNPATHYYDKLFWWLSFFGVDTDLIDNDEIVAWRQECIDRGYEVSYIETGQAIGDVLEAIAVAGFATRGEGVKYTIDYFRDRTAETPRMVFSPRNAAEISFQRVWPGIPKGNRVKFSDENNDYKQSEIFVNHQQAPTTFNENEAINYPSITNPDLVKLRTRFDQMQTSLRPLTWKIRGGPSAYNRKRGELVLFVTDLLSDYVHGFVVREVLSATEIRVDRSVIKKSTELLDDVTDLTAEDDILAIGGSSSIQIVMPTGVEEYTIASVNGPYITLGSALSDTDILNTQAIIAPDDDLHYRRGFIIHNARESKERSTLTVVDEIPFINSEMARLNP